MQINSIATILSTPAASSYIKTSAQYNQTPELTKSNTTASTVVELSQAGMEKFSSQESDEIPAAHKQLSENLHADPDQVGVGDVVKRLALTPEGPLMSITNLLAGGHDVTYSGNGKLVTPESEAYFEKINKSVQADKESLYNSEVAKGTPPADIYDKMMSMMSKQPKEYLEMMDWFGV